MTIREPRWTEQDRVEVLALAVYRQGLCPKCGRPVEICTSPEGAGPEFQVVASLCRATRSILEEQRKRSEGGKKPVLNAEAFLFATTVLER